MNSKRLRQYKQCQKVLSPVTISRVRIRSKLAYRFRSYTQPDKLVKSLYCNRALSYAKPFILGFEFGFRANAESVFHFKLI